MTIFRYSPEIVDRYPSVTGGVIYLADVRNSPTTDALKALYANEQQRVIAEIGDTPLSDFPTVAEWRRVFRSFGVDPTQVRFAGEALLRRLSKQGDIPSINALVDIGNLISIRYKVPVAVVDTRHITGDLVARFADGSERFTNLGTAEVVHPDVGEVIFADESGLVFARRWCWRQSDQCAARDDTTQAMIITEAHGANSRALIQQAAGDFEPLLALLGIRVEKIDLIP
jgi:DNA/RNA-binding domain of Phe-tRNA-synthetase-like protein